MTKVCRICNKENPLENFSKDSSAKDGLRRICKKCDVASVMKRREKDMEKHVEKHKEWRNNNQEYIAAARKAYKEKNPDYEKTYYQLRREAKIKSSTRWKVENRERWAMLQSGRRARERNQTPKWANKTAILSIYEECARLRNAGQNVQVDHIVPLNGKTVSGLHCEANLRIISAKENSSKRNIYWPEMP